jgi:hypothetical protein
MVQVAKVAMTGCDAPTVLRGCGANVSTYVDDLFLHPRLRARR